MDVRAEAGQLNRTGEQLRRSGQYQEAEQLYRRALALAPQLDPADPLAGCVTDNLGTLYAETGRYRAAIDQHLQALRILPRDCVLDRAITTSNLGIAYFLLGDLHAALDFSRTARKLHESTRTLTKDYLGTLLNIATVQSALGDSADALKIVGDALEYCAVWEQVHVGEPNEYRRLAGLMNAQMQLDTGDLAAAAPVINEAVTAYTALMGPAGEHTLTARAAQAKLLRLQDAPGAEAALLALLTDLVAVNANSGTTEASRYELAHLYQAQGRVADEAVQLIDNMNSEEVRTSQMLPYSARRDQINTVTRNHGRFFQFMALLDRAGADHPELAGIALEHWLRRKGATADILREFADQDESAPATAAQQELSRLRGELAEDLRLSSSSMIQDHDEWQARRERVRTNRAAIDELERSAAGRERLDGIALLRSDLGAQLPPLLPPGCVLLEFCSLAVRDSGPAYGVFVVTGGGDGTAKYRYLDAYDAIERLVEATLDEITASAAVRGVSREGDDDLPADDFSARTVAALARFAAAIDDVLPAGTTRLIISADAGLCALPFQLLPRPDGTRWIDAFAIGFVSSATDLLTPAVAAGEPPGRAVVVAGPQFSTVGRTQPYRELTGARSEGIAVAERLGVPARVGAEATRSAVLAAGRPVVLHLATHGFYARDKPFGVVLTRMSGSGPAGLVEGKPPVMATIEPRPDPLDVDLQLLMGGLALAGANDAAFERERGRPLADDGELLAADIAALDLGSTELVVLSACDTGRGTAVPGQGMWGLPLALQAAGAAAIVISLWGVNDDSTKRLMTAFYDRLLAGDTKAVALQAASNEVRKADPHPRFWAAFIAVGDDSPLSTFAAASRP